MCFAKVRKSLIFQGLSALFPQRLFFDYCSIGREVLHQICDGISLRGDVGGGEGLARGARGIDTEGMVDEIFVKATRLDLLGGEVSRQLVQDRTDHFRMPELLRAYRRLKLVIYLDWRNKV